MTLMTEKEDISNRSLFIPVILPSHKYRQYVSLAGFLFITDYASEIMNRGQSVFHDSLRGIFPSAGPFLLPNVFSWEIAWKQMNTFKE